MSIPSGPREIWVFFSDGTVRRLFSSVETAGQLRQLFSSVESGCSWEFFIASTTGYFSGRHGGFVGRNGAAALFFSRDGRSTPAPLFFSRVRLFVGVLHSFSSVLLVSIFLYRSCNILFHPFLFCTVHVNILFHPFLCCTVHVIFCSIRFYVVPFM
ncbi:hypothetical protein LINPERHAP1_LOCUS18990 [Linum perenne]